MLFANPFLVCAEPNRSIRPVDRAGQLSAPGCPSSDTAIRPGIPKLIVTSVEGLPRAPGESHLTSCIGHKQSPPVAARMSTLRLTPADRLPIRTPRGRLMQPLVVQRSSTWPFGALEQFGHAELSDHAPRRLAATAQLSGGSLVMAAPQTHNESVDMFSMRRTPHRRRPPGGTCGYARPSNGRGSRLPRQVAQCRFSILENRRFGGSGLHMAQGEGQTLGRIGWMSVPGGGAARGFPAFDSHRPSAALGAPLPACGERG